MGLVLCVVPVVLPAQSVSNAARDAVNAPSAAAVETGGGLLSPENLLKDPADHPEWRPIARGSRTSRSGDISLFGANQWCSGVKSELYPIVV
jgi:hypothetical protein